eukprot:s409_g3.t1
MLSLISHFLQDLPNFNTQLTQPMGFRAYHDAQCRDWDTIYLTNATHEFQAQPALNAPAEILWFGAVVRYFVFFVFRLCSEAEILWFGAVVRYFVFFVFRLCSEAEILWFGAVVCCCHVLRNYALYTAVLLASFVYNDFCGNLALCDTIIAFANVVYGLQPLRHQHC